MYSKSGCNFCDMTSNWFNEHNIRFTEVKLDDEEQRLAFYQKINNTQETIGDGSLKRRVNSMPQIYIDDKHIGTTSADKLQSDKLDKNFHHASVKPFLKFGAYRWEANCDVTQIYKDVTLIKKQ